MAMHPPTTPELTVPALAAWLKRRNPERTYTYQDPTQCLLGQYFTDHDAEEGISESVYEQFPHYREIAQPKPHTFRAALGRAQQLLALPPPSPNFDRSRIGVDEPEPSKGADH